jgi:pyruvate/2-oxoglutarate dehydrogenase complex dihydrolipoamide acyltransferase (E2) component
VVGEDVQWLRQKEHTMAETYEVPEYIPGDHVELRLYLRHKHNVVAVEAGFAHESNSNVSFTRRNAPELERHEGDEKVSVVRFAPMRVSPDSPLGEYRCTYVLAYYPTSEGQPQRGANLSVPHGLRFRIVEEPADPPQVSDWSWAEQNSMRTVSSSSDNDESAAEEEVDESAAEEEVEAESEVKATLAATRKAKELGTDLSMVEGTGSGGRITVRDVENAAEEEKEEGEE